MSQNVWATIMPFGPVTLIFYWPSFQALDAISGYYSYLINFRFSNMWNFPLTIKPKIKIILIE